MRDLTNCGANRLGLPAHALDVLYIVTHNIYHSICRPTHTTAR